MLYGCAVFLIFLEYGCSARSCFTGRFMLSDISISMGTCWLSICTDSEILDYMTCHFDLPFPNSSYLLVINCFLCLKLRFLCLLRFYFLTMEFLASWWECCLVEGTMFGAFNYTCSRYINPMLTIWCTQLHPFRGSFVQLTGTLFLWIVNICDTTAFPNVFTARCVRHL